MFVCVCVCVVKVLTQRCVTEPEPGQRWTVCVCEAVFLICCSFCLCSRQSCWFESAVMDEEPLHTCWQ